MSTPGNRARDENNNPASLYNIAKGLYYTDDFSNAENKFDAVLSLIPNHVKAMYWKGKALLKQSKNDEAIEWFDKSITEDRRFAGAWYYKGKALEGVGKREDAQECFNESSKLDSSVPIWGDDVKHPHQLYSIVSEFYAGKSQAALGDLKTAEGHYRRAIDLCDEHRNLLGTLPVYWSRKGKVYLEMGELDRALVCFKNSRLRELVGDRGETMKRLVSVGKVEAMLGKLDKALESFNKALDIAPGNTRILFYRGLVRLEMGDYAGAASDFSKIVKAEPLDSHARFLEARARQKMKYQSA